MMSEVVMHPRAAEGRARQAARDMESAGLIDNQREFFEERIRIQALLRHAYARMEERPLMHRPEERRRVGENLWMFLEEIEKGPRGVSKARVLQKAIHADPIDSTKHLARYAFRPSQDPTEAEHRSRYLLKKVAKFVHVAKIAAELGGLDPETSMLRILEGTWYTQDLPEDPLKEDRTRRTGELMIILADIAERLRTKYRLDAAIQRMENAGWALRTPGDLTSPMHVDPTLVNKNLSLDQNEFWTMVQWSQIERYPLVHLGYVTVSKNSEVGYVLGRFHFEDENGETFVSPPRFIPVYFHYLCRIDIVLFPDAKQRAPNAEFRFALSPVTWFKPTELLSWQSPSGTKFWIGPEETIGEIEAYVEPYQPRAPAFRRPPPRPPAFRRRPRPQAQGFAPESITNGPPVPPPSPRGDAEFNAAMSQLSSHDQEILRQGFGNPDLMSQPEFQAARQNLDRTLAAQTTLIEPRATGAPEATEFCEAEDSSHSKHLMHLQGAHLTWAHGSWTGSLALLTDEERRAVSSVREVELRNLIDRMKECQPPSYRGPTLLSCFPPIQVLDEAVRHRHFGSNPSIAHLWTDERPNVSSYADHPLAQDPVPAAEILDPIQAPEGTLSARLERWIRGDLENRGTLEAELEAAVAAFMARIEATASSARDRLTSAVYGKR
jgi:hypothetical protein